MLPISVTINPLGMKAPNHQHLAVSDCYVAFQSKLKHQTFLVLESFVFPSLSETPANNDFSGCFDFGSGLGTV